MIVTRRGTLETIGYTEPDASARIDTFLARPGAYLVDIRLTPYSRFRPAWNRPALRSRYGRRYLHLRGLGNVHYQDRSQPIHLLDPEPHVAHLAESLAEGYSYLLLCACKEYARCHRKVVYERVLLALGEQPETTAGTLWAVSLWAQG